MYTYFLWVPLPKVAHGPANAFCGFHHLMPLFLRTFARFGARIHMVKSKLLNSLGRQTLMVDSLTKHDD